MSQTPGLDLDRAGSLLLEAADGRLSGPLDAEVISGGRSNLTYLVRGRTGQVVLRRPPLGLVLPSAHDMAREYRVTAALAEAGFPVARPLLLCTDEDVIGAPFYIMEYVDGVVLRGETLREVPPDAARRHGDLLVDTLLRLHAIDYTTIGLESFGRPDGYLLRQVQRWHRQWESAKTRELPLLEEVTARLLDGVPVSPRPGIVHGDYRLDNVMLDRSLTGIAAVMDWEMATIGDPLADVGLLVVYSDQTGLRLTPRVPEGFPSGPALAERYARGSGIPLAGLDWYIAFGHFKLAVISEGIHARYLQGKTVGEGFDTFGAAVPVLIEQAHATLRKG
ncbi:phosphotransferase family protein [Rugosimonospora acidiphila]|uniref:Phosphotransferase family protein n=1 Tax=Rugosimonospora acidiphila TaxID=556531 RepID=A0ABP9SUL2_9ACTN